MLKLIIGLLVYVVTVIEVQASENSLVTLTMENDIFAGQDGGYTNGIAISWGYGAAPDIFDLEAAQWLKSLANKTYLADFDGNKAFTYIVFQGMQTPENIASQELQSNDLPYAGLLGGGISLHAWDDITAHQLNMTVGIVGPASLAEDAQKIIHRMTSSDKPQGWDHQLGNELVFAVNARKSWRIRESFNGIDFDLIAAVEGGGGTLQSSLATSFIARFGTNLESTHHLATVLPGREVNPLAGSIKNHFYFYLGGQAAYFINDIFVDGNTFKSSHSLPLEHERYIFSTGAAWNWEQWGLLLSMAHTSSPTSISSKRAKFGSLSISYRF